MVVAPSGLQEQTGATHTGASQTICPLYDPLRNIRSLLLGSIVNFSFLSQNVKVLLLTPKSCHPEGFMERTEG